MADPPTVADRTLQNTTPGAGALGTVNNMTPVQHTLALVRALTRADAVVLEAGTTRVADGDEALAAHPLPLLRTLLVVRDARADSRFAALATRSPIRTLVGVPVCETTHAGSTLWLVCRQPDAVTSDVLGALTPHLSILDALVAPVSEGESLKHFVAVLPTPAICVDPDGRVFSNQAAATLTGYSAEETPTRELWFSSVYGAEAVTVQAIYEVDRAQGFLDSRTFPVTRPDGSERLVEFTATAIGEREVWMLTDVTERVASQERFRLLFEQSSTAHLLFDGSSILDCNPAAVALLGYRSKSDLLRVEPKDLSPEVQPDGDRSALKAAHMETIAFELGSHRFDWTYRTASGEAAPVEVTLTPLTLGARRILMAEWHDITERLRYEAGLTKARDSALEFARAKADFLATMSHEIRTPMNGVIGMTRLLAETDLNLEQREYVETVRACGEGLLALINDILDFSKLEAGRVALENIPFSVRDLVEDALAVVSMTAHQKGLELAGIVAEHVPDLCLGDPTRLRQVLLNLLSNAVKFTSSGEVCVTVDAPTRDSSGKRVLSFAVADSGIGIAPDALPRLFTAFSQEDTSTTRRFGGTGLGLAICKRLLGLMGGVIDVTTGPRGTTFTVTLTLSEIADAATPDLRGRAVVVLAPDRSSARALVTVLEPAGASVRVAASVAEAKQLTAPGQFVLVSERSADAEKMARELCASGLRVGLITSRPGTTTDDGVLAFVLPKPVRRRQLYSALSKELVPAYVPGATAPTPALVRLAGVRVLVAEDNPVNQRVVRGLLSKLGCDVVIVENGRRALEALSATKFEVVLMDCQMPELDGFETTERLRATEVPGARLPVIALTAAAMGGDRERCLAAGMDDFLSKPIRLEDLERTLVRWVKRGAAADHAA